MTKIITDRMLKQFIEDAKTDTEKKYTQICAGKNLWLRVHTKTGASAWLYRIALPDPTKRSGYKFSNMSFATYPDTPLDIAREKATQFNELIKKRIDPSAMLSMVNGVDKLWSVLLNKDYDTITKLVTALESLESGAVNDELELNKIQIEPKA